MRDPLTEVDMRILAELANAHDEDSVLGADLASAVGVPGKAIGSRLMALRKRGLVVSHVPPNANRYKAWHLTQAGVEAAAFTRNEEPC